MQVVHSSLFFFFFFLFIFFIFFMAPHFFPFFVKIFIFFHFLTIMWQFYILPVGIPGPFFSTHIALVCVLGNNVYMQHY